jgi:hypothetical protein
MSIAKTLCLSLAAVIILAAHSAPSFAAGNEWIEVLSYQPTLWDYLYDLLW